LVRLSFRAEGRPVAELVGELTGRHANLVLLDGAGCVQAALAPSRPGSERARRLAPGAAYAPPPGRRAAPLDPGPALAEAFPAGPEGGEREAALAPLSSRVERTFGAVSLRRFEDEARRELVRRLERRLASARALVAGLEQRREACAEAERLRRDGELLLAHLASIARGAREVELPDAFEPGAPPRRIALDPGLSARRNAEKLFARYKKLVRTRERLPEELERARQGVSDVEQWLARAGFDPPAELEQAAVAAGLLTPQSPARARVEEPAPRLPYLRFRGLRGGEIRVGRSARDNDQLTFREARGNDLWLHTADAPGSHVVLRLERDAEPDDEEVLDAAHLAVHFSPLRGRPRADVHVARRKDVHKPRKAPAGLVTLSGGKLLRLRIEPERLARLLATRTSRRGAPAGPADREPDGEADEDAAAR
jgi:predicted ribosome quality control (RQC) complex YloA/Tae2 family protein